MAKKYETRAGSAWGRTDTPPVVGLKTTKRTTLDLDTAFWADLQGWLGQQQAAAGKRVQLAPVMRELLREITGDALGPDATEEERAAVEALARRVIGRAAA